MTRPLTRVAWTPSEVARLREVYPVHSNLEVASLMGRTRSSITMKAKELELRKTPAFKGRQLAARFQCAVCGSRNLTPIASEPSASV